MKYDQQTEHFSPSQFLAINLGTLGLIFAGFKLIFPNLWADQLAASFGLLFVTFLLCHLANAFVEYFFHRYVLHAQVIPFFKHFYQTHNLHHQLTDVYQSTLTTNKFPIIEEPQHESSFFPYWSLAAFALFLSPIYILIWYLFPTVPIFLAGFISLFWSMLLYELFHLAWHWPLQTITPLIKNPRWGGFWKLVYTFHLRHHANVRCNESVSGFFGLPLPDLLFGTYMRSYTVFPDQTVVPPTEYSAPKPYLPIRLLDRILIKDTK